MPYTECSDNSLELVFLTLKRPQSLFEKKLAPNFDPQNLILTPAVFVQLAIQDILRKSGFCSKTFHKIRIWARSFRSFISFYKSNLIFASTNLQSLLKVSLFPYYFKNVRINFFRCKGNSRCLRSFASNLNWDSYQQRIFSRLQSRDKTLREYCEESKEAIIKVILYESLSRPRRNNLIYFAFISVCKWKMLSEEWKQKQKRNEKPFASLLHQIEIICSINQLCCSEISARRETLRRNTQMR